MNRLYVRRAQCGPLLAKGRRQRRVTFVLLTMGPLYMPTPCSHLCCLLVNISLSITAASSVDLSAYAASASIWLPQEQLFFVVADMQETTSISAHLYEDLPLMATHQQSVSWHVSPLYVCCCFVLAASGDCRQSMVLLRFNVSR